jgi:hypothetical protein
VGNGYEKQIFVPHIALAFQIATKYCAIGFQVADYTMFFKTAFPES